MDDGQEMDSWRIREPGSRERTWFALSGLARGLIWASPFVTSALLWAFLARDSITSGMRVVLLSAGIAFLLFWTIWGLLIWRTRMYAYTNNEVMVERGVLHISRIFVSYDHVQYLDHRSGPIQRKFALARVELQTAAGDVRIEPLQVADALEIEQRVRRADRQVELL